MSFEKIEQGIKNATAVLAMAKVLYRQLKELEDPRYYEIARHFEFLRLVQTSIYATLVLNLSYLVDEREENSITSIVNSAARNQRLTAALAQQIKTEIETSRPHINDLKYNRDKRIAHFDVRDISPLGDETIVRLLQLAESQIAVLNGEVLGKTHDPSIALSWSIRDGIEILKKHYEETSAKLNP